MLNKNLLRAAIVAKGLTLTDVAEYIGISRKTFSIKMSKGIFASDEIGKMMKLLSITDPIPIFFNDDVTLNVTDTLGE